MAFSSVEVGRAASVQGEVGLEGASVPGLVFLPEVVAPALVFGLEEAFAQAAVDLEASVQGAFVLEASVQVVIDQVGADQEDAGWGELGWEVAPAQWEELDPEEAALAVA